MNMFVFIPVKSYILVFLYLTIFLNESSTVFAENGYVIPQKQQSPELLIVGNTLPYANYYQPVYTPAGYYTPLVKPIYHLPPSYVKPPPKEAQYTLTNLTTNVGGRLEVPFGERSTLAFSFPPMNEKMYSHDPHTVKFDEEPSTNIGSVIVDTFVLKERGVLMDSQMRPLTRPNSAILGGILKNVLTENSNKKEKDQDDAIHSPGELISMEIPLNGAPDYTGLGNLTEFLIDETSKVRIRKGHQNHKEQVPMFVALQFHTVGRNKVKTYDEGAEKKVAIHVVLGHKHFEFKNIHQLNRLYEYVKPDYYIYKPTYGVPDYYGPIVQNVLLVPEPKFYISKATVDLICEFVEFTWKIHKETHEATNSRGKFIMERLIALIRRNENRKRKPEEIRFRPERPWVQPQVDFFTWPYTNTLAFRTLVM